MVVGPNGHPTLLEQDIQVHGYASIDFNDVVLCFNDIISLHIKVIATWTNTRTQFSGPLVEHIMEKLVISMLRTSRALHLPRW